MCEIYKYFASSWEQSLDYSEESMLELYLSESYGDVDCQNNNGYYVGKRWLNVNVAMWKEDIKKGLLTKYELYSDPQIPDWWLDKIFKVNQ